MYEHRKFLHQLINDMGEGSQTLFGKKIGATSKQVNKWLNRDQEVPIKYAILIEIATKGKVKWWQLCPSMQPYASFIQPNIHEVDLPCLLSDIKQLMMSINEGLNKMLIQSRGVRDERVFENIT